MRCDLRKIQKNVRAYVYVYVYIKSNVFSSIFHPFLKQRKRYTYVEYTRNIFVTFCI